MKEIIITVRGSVSGSTNISCHAAILEYNSYRKLITKYNGIIDTSANKEMLKGILEALNLVKEPCSINIKAPTTLGITNKKYKGLYPELVIPIQELISSADHKITFTITDDRQSELKNILKELKATHRK